VPSGRRVEAARTRPLAPAGTIGPVGAPDLVQARDRELVARLRLGDEEAFRDLFRRYAPTALALAGRVVRDQNLAQEVVQEAFLALWRSPDAYDPEQGSVRAWLVGIVHHRAVDAVRRLSAEQRRAERAAAVDPPVDVAEEVLEGIETPRERRAVREALAALPPPQREVIELMYYGGLSQSAIAKRLSLPLGTVKSRTLLAMRRLRAALVEDAR